MEFNINRVVFNEAIRKVMRAISSHTTIPTLTGVHLSVSQEGLLITGSDSNLSIRVMIPNDKIDGAEIINEGDIILPARELSGIARSMPDSIISFKSVGELRIDVVSGKSKFTLNGVDGSQYPRLPKVDGEGFTIKGEVLTDLVEKTVYAVSTVETRPILTGVNLFIEQGKLGMVATDSHRLARVVGGDVDTPNTKEITIPQKTLKELPALLNDSKDVTVIQHESQIAFRTDDVYVLSRLLEGSYPETSRLIPNSCKTTLTMNTKGFLSAIERSAILAEKAKNVVTLKISDKNNGMFETIELSHKNGELGESKEEIIVEKIEGEEVILSFNPKYIIEALKRIDDDKVVVEFNGAMRPFILKPFNSANNFIQLVLPVRTF